MAFAAIVGQYDIKQRLGHALTGNPGHAYVFAGPKGIGRTHVARVFAKALLCQESGPAGACSHCPSCRYMDGQVHPDYTEVLLQKKESNIPVETIRQRVAADLYMQPQLGQRKVYLIAGDDLNEQGQNALLKSLEEPPDYAVFLLTATGAGSLLPTILSRSSMMMLSRSHEDELLEILQQRGYLDHPEALFFARFSGGLPGVALSMAESSWFGSLRQETLAFYLALPQTSRAALLTTGYQFFDSNKQYAPDILDMLGSMIRDQLVMRAGGADTLIINSDQAGQLRHMLASQNQKTDMADRLTRAYGAILAARRGLAQNASYEGLICHMMLVLRKELTYA